MARKSPSAGRTIRYCSKTRCSSDARVSCFMLCVFFPISFSTIYKFLLSKRIFQSAAEALSAAMAWSIRPSKLLFFVSARTLRLECALNYEMLTSRNQSHNVRLSDVTRKTLRQCAMRIARCRCAPAVRAIQGRRAARVSCCHVIYFCSGSFYYFPETKQSYAWKREI